MVSLIFEVQDKDNRYYRNAMRTVGLGDDRPRLRLAIDQGDVRVDCSPSVVFDGSNASLNFESSGARTLLFRQRHLRTKENFGDDVTTWSVVFAWEGSIRDLSERVGECTLAIVYDSSLPPDLCLDVQAFEEIETRSSSDGGVLVRLAFNVPEGRAFPAGTGTCLLLLDAEMDTE